MAVKLKILVTGANGFVGSHFVEKASDFELFTPGSAELNLKDPKEVRKYIEKIKPDWIVNFAAFTDVNKAEEQKGDKKGEAWQINVEGVKNLLQAFDSKNFIQISTDMVFPGSEDFPGPYKESDTPSDKEEVLTWYGWTKNRAEKLVSLSGGAILRIIYPVSFQFDKKNDYIKNPVKRFAMGKMYPLFNDQQVSVSYIEEIAEALIKIIKKGFHGVFHVSSDTTTPYDLIKKTLESMGEDTGSMKSSSVVEFLKTQLNKARYPIFGGLEASKTAEVLGMHFSSWKEMLVKLPNKAIGPREYKNLEIPNAVVVNPTKYHSKPEGYVMETADFTELSYFLGYKFEPRSSYAIWSPEGIGRGGHLESRSKMATILSGLVYYCMVDLREGESFKRVCQFYLGEGEQAIGRSVLVPEGVVDYWIPIGGPALAHIVGDRPYNKFDNRVTMDMTDPAIGLNMPEGANHSRPVDDDADGKEETVGLLEFIKKIRR